MSTFDNPSMSIGYVGKSGHLFGFLRHYLLIVKCIRAYLFEILRGRLNRTFYSPPPIILFLFANHSHILGGNCCECGKD